ncbi:MAG: hypothetical protein KAJ78_00530 [Acidobacteria bacterium]|nr:hypothetical protein [Acidobacteriota bacterium]
MEYFHYVNIFETKGLEYILVIVFMITFVFFVRNLDAPLKKNGGARAGGQIPQLGDTIVVVKDKD